MINSATRLCLVMVFLAAAMPAQVAITEYCNDPYSSSNGGIDANLDGNPATSSSQSDDEFVEIVNFGSSTVDIGGWTLSDAAATRHTFVAGTMLPAGAAVVVFGGGSVANFNSIGLAGVLADSGSIGLNNSSDTISLLDSTGTAVDVVVYSSGGPGDGDGESITRVPEAPTGTFTKHLIASGIAHSAGYMNDGTTPYGAATFPGVAYPGTAEDFALETGVNSSPSPTAIKSATAGDLVTVYIDSPSTTFVGEPIILAGELFSTGAGAPMGFLPGVNVSINFFFLIDGTVSSPLGAPSLPFQGTYISYTLPTGLAGQSVLLQAMSLSGAAANGIYATSEGHEIQIQ